MPNSADIEFTPSKTGYKSRYIAGMNCGSSVGQPQGSLYAVAATGYSLLEASDRRAGAATTRVGNLRRLTSRGTPGAAVTEGKFDDDAAPAQCEAFLTHTGVPTYGDTLHPFREPTSAGFGMYFGFYGRPLEVPIGTANGVGFVFTATAGAGDVTFVWEE